MRLLSKNKLIYGIGINDADYNVYIYSENHKVVWRCPFYVCWKSMLERCYSSKYQIKRPTYVGCTVCEDWVRFSNFKSWMEQQEWSGNSLDKDILFPNNKIYGPNTRVFITTSVNVLIVEKKTRKSNLPIGVHIHEDKKYVSQISIEGKPKYLGWYNTPEEAHSAWLIAKIEEAYSLAAKQTDERVAKALIDRYENYASYFKFTEESRTVPSVVFGD